MGAALETVHEWYQQRDRAARTWKQHGGRVVGYLCDNVPEELILAAGFMPYRLSALPNTGTDAIERYVQPFAAPFSARNRGVGFTDSMLNLLLSNAFDFLDYLIVPHTRKTIQAFYRELNLAREAFPELRLPELYYLDRAYTPFYTSEIFNRRCVLDLQATLEGWSARRFRKWPWRRRSARRIAGAACSSGSPRCARWTRRAVAAWTPCS